MARRGAKKNVSPITTIIVIVIVVLLCGFLFWKSAKGKPARTPGLGRFMMQTPQQQEKQPARQGPRGGQRGR